MQFSVLADTHALVWYILHPNKLSPKALATLEQANQNGEFIYVSAISLIELGYLIEKNRLPEEVLQRLIAATNDPDRGVMVLPVDTAVGLAIRRIPRAVVPEMADRIIAATALHFNLPLVTRDQQILALQEIKTIW